MIRKGTLVPTPLLLFIALAVILRFAALRVSLRNEARMKRDGAVEFHARTSAVLAAVHIAYYLCAIGEAEVTGAAVSGLSIAGMVLWALSMLALGWVMRVLGRFWTVKIIVARDHHLVTNALFRRLRHPNYILNLLPEMIGLALALSAWWTLAVGLPVYLAVLALRIRQEEAIMRGHFPDY